MVTTALGRCVSCLSRWTRCFIFHIFHSAKSLCVYYLCTAYISCTVDHIGVGSVHLCTLFPNPELTRNTNGVDLD